eukprot:314390-Chlamydomonas_euryale.AAC.1
MHAHLVTLTYLVCGVPLRKQCTQHRRRLQLPRRGALTAAVRAGERRVHPGERLAQPAPMRAHHKQAVLRAPRALRVGLSVGASAQKVLGRARGRGQALARRD